jgi:hypothetical protein
MIHRVEFNGEINFKVGHFLCERKVALDISFELEKEVAGEDAQIENWDNYHGALDILYS